MNLMHYILRQGNHTFATINFLYFSRMPQLSTTSIHGADNLHRASDVTPPINISTTFKYPSDPDKLQKMVPGPWPYEVGNPIYSREAHPTGELVEQTIAKITKSHAVAYNSGLSAVFAAFTHFNPKKLFIGKGYHGVNGITEIWQRNHGLEKYGLTDDDLAHLEKGDLIHLETPVNPESLALDIQYYADKAHAAGAFLLVDSTFAPPPLQDAFEFGADMVMHSATKYFGGHSDLLAGVLLTKSEGVYRKLIDDRIYLGTNIANLESALLLRSLKTLELRVLRQSQNATKIVQFLNESKKTYPAIVKVYHSSLQTEPYVTRQLKGGHSPTFSFELKTEDQARRFPSHLKYFYHATSLGGVESLIEWRAMSDHEVSPSLLRVSVGLEDVDDLIGDIEQALKAI